MASHTKFTMKLLVNTATNKVIFAEASKEVVDFLFSLLEMPIGSIAYLFKKGVAPPGSFDTLFKSLEVLDEAYLQSTRVKAAILNPVFRSFAASYSNILLPASVSEKKAYYFCNESNCIIAFTDIYGAPCPTCKAAMTTLTFLVKTSDTNLKPLGYVKSLVNYNIMDNLTVFPASAFTSSNLLLKERGFSIGDDFEETVVELGLDECLKLLKSSLQSTTVLSDVFLEPKSAADSKAGRT